MSAIEFFNRTDCIQTCDVEFSFILVKMAGHCEDYRDFWNILHLLICIQIHEI